MSPQSPDTPPPSQTPSPPWESSEGEPPHDQLLTEIPPTDYHRGRFSGYDAGRRVRRGLAIAAACGLLLSGLAYLWAVQHAEWRRTHPFVLPPDTDLSELTRTLYWNEGRGRFALDVEAPGVERLILPDRTLVLAEDSERAQVIVYVEGGVTTSIEVLSGHVVQRLSAQP